MRKEIVGDTLEITNTETGEIRSIKLATDKQMAFIRNLENNLKLTPRAYRGLTIWQAKKVIDKLLKKQRPML
jgi:archaeosine-15-forming tRNA-guanine transglycosylase